MENMTMPESRRPYKKTESISEIMLLMTSGDKKGHSHFSESLERKHRGETIL